MSLVGMELERQLRDLYRRVRALETTQPVGYTSVTEGRLRVASNEGLLVQGSEKVEGWLVVTGTQNLVGTLNGTGTCNWSGPFNLTGAWTFGGSGDIAGNVNISGALDVLSRLTLGPSGYIEAGGVRIDRYGAYGSRIAAPGGTLWLTGNRVLVGALTLETQDIDASGQIRGVSLDIAGFKSFRIPHPVKPDHWLRHGCTESPVSGVEYWGEETLPDTGELVVELPDYFEALTKPENRAVLVTARGFVADWGDIVDGKFTVTGKPGGRFSWLVKAERDGAEFLLEEPVSVEAEV